MAESGQIRPSMFISTFGPGAVIDLPETSVIIAGIDDWDKMDCSPIIEPRLSKRLAYNNRRMSFRTLPLPKDFSPASPATLPTRRFPNWYVCPNCRRLAPYLDFFEEKGVFLCRSCQKDGLAYRAFPARFVIACRNGHLSDFPWRWFVHQPYGNFDSCEGGKKQQGNLRLMDLGSTGSIADVTVECTKCGSQRSLADAFQKGLARAALGKCHGNRPWLGSSSSDLACTEIPRAMLRGASNIYFSCTVSALSIPPYNSAIHQTLDVDFFESLKEVESIADLQTAARLGVCKSLFEQFTIDEVWAGLQQQKQIADEDENDLYYPEWQAITAGSVSAGVADYDFQIFAQPAPRGFETSLAAVIQVHRLREVRVLTGFTRIDPPPDLTSLMAGEATTRRQAHLSKRNLGWLPALETRGEGIFIQFNETEIANWEGRPAVINAAQNMERAWEAYHDSKKADEEERPPFPGPRYVFLHTFSHLVMRQLCLQCGYSLSSIRERIYCRSNSSANMAGILIYTATPDSEGSLGGLVELGHPDRFRSIVWHAVEGARFCSADPLCSEYRPENTGTINAAACHVCLLLPETCCERSNRFLDRAFVSPTLSVKDCSYFP